MTVEIEAPKDSEVLSLDKRGRTAYVPEALRGYLTEFKNRHKYKRQSSTVFYPSKAGYMDPLTGMCVLDLVMRLDTTDIIRAKYLSKLLQQTHPQVQWNPIVVGQHLADIWRVCDENFSTIPDQCPITTSRDWEGVRYRLNPTTEGWKWLNVMRDYIGDSAVDTAKAIREGKEVRRQGSIWGGLPLRIDRDA
jgi:hypothetical protein